MTAELPPTNPGLIADDSYWEGPAIPIEGRFGAAMSNLKLHADQAEEVVDLVRQMSRRQLDITPIADFDTIAQPTEGPPKLIKVVQDTRWLRTPSPLTISTEKRWSAFEERAKTIAETDLYLGRKARTWASHSSWRTAEVRREVYYFTYNEGDRHLFGVPSDRFAAYHENELQAHRAGLVASGAIVRPPLLVGQVYEKGLIAHRGLTKVIAADILELKLYPSARRLRPRSRLPRGDQGLSAHNTQWSGNGVCAQVVSDKNLPANMLN